MGSIGRKTFNLGWVPDADSVNAPDGALLRADNIEFDELGVASLRAGSSKVNSVAYADASAANDIRSLYTATISGTRYRMSQVSDEVFANGSSIVTGFGANDVQFASYLGHIFFAASTVKSKYDGSTSTNWGIAQPGAAPTIAVQAADSDTFATCDSGESPAFDAATEGTSAPTHQPDRNAVANASLEVIPDATTGRGTIMRPFASDQDFTTYSGGQTGTDNDLVDFYLYVEEPANLQSVKLMIDVANTTTNHFEDDYYFYEFLPSQPIQVPMGIEDFLSEDFTVYGFDRNFIRSKIEEFRPPVSDIPTILNGWNHFSVARGKFSRVGSANGRNWSTVTAIRLHTKHSVGGAANAVRWDNIQIVGGNQRPLTGRYRYRYVYVNQLTNYQAKSEPSAASAEIELKAQGTTVTCPADAGRDSQTDEIWLYRMGGMLDRFYRVAVETGVSGTGAVTIDDETSDQTALITNEVLEVDNKRPPDSIVGIEGPYYDRLFALTASHLYPCRRRNPDSFSDGQSIRISAGDETCLWIKKALNGLYIGTTKDIYRLDGNGDEFPDGTIDFRITPMNIGVPPISSGCAQEGNQIAYVGHDGWRLFNGIQSSRIPGNELLWRGETRHGVSSVNSTSTTARFRGAISARVLTALTPEGTSTTNSSVFQRFDMDDSRWLRHTYTPTFMSVYREPDGTLLAGDTDGFVWELDTGTQDDSADIPVVLWTPSEDGGMPDQKKDGMNFKGRFDTGGNTLTIELYIDGSSAISKTLTGSSSGVGTIHSDISSITQFTQLQQRLTGSFSTFRYYDYVVNFVEAPRVMVFWDTGPVDFGVDDLAWVREIRLKVRTPANLTVTPYFDGVRFSPYTYTIGTDANRELVVRVPVARNYKGTQPRVHVTTADGTEFTPYWMEFFFRGSGNRMQKKAFRVRP